MESAVAPVKRRDRPDEADPVARALFYLAVTFAAATAALAGLLIGVRPAGRLIIALSVTLCFAGALGVAALLAGRGRIRQAIMLALAAGYLCTTAFALLADAGVFTSAFGFYGLLVVAAGLLLGARAGWILSLACAATLIAGWGAESAGWLTDSSAQIRMAPTWRAGTELALLGISVILSTLIARALQAAAGTAGFAGPRRAGRDLPLDKNERQCWALFDLSPLPQVIHRDAVVLMANGAAAQLFGVAGPSELIGKELLQFYAAEDSDRVAVRIAQLESMSEGGGLPVAELTVRGADGSIRVVQGTGVRVMLGGKLATLSVYCDITERKRAEEQVRRSEAMLSRLFDACPDYLAVSEVESGRLHRVNEGFCEITGIPRGEATGRTVLELGIWANPAQRQDLVRQLTASDVARNVPATIRRRDGERRQVQFSCATFDMDGRQFMVANGHDVTDAQRAAAALRRSESMLSRLFEASPDAIVVSEVRTSRLAMINERFVSMFGYSRDELIGRTSLELGIWVDPAQRLRVVEGVERDGIVHALPVTRRTKDGRVLSMRYSAARMQLDGEQYMIAALRDVTEQEREHLQSQAILDNASVGIAFTRDRVFQLVNPRFEEMFGWEPGTLAGRSGAVVWPSPEAYGEVGRRLGPRLAQGELIAEEVPMQRRHGGAFWCRLLARAIDPDNPVSGGTIWIAEDVTSEHNAAAELAAAKDAAESANRAKTAFLANTSHELRTPLNGLLGLTRLALRPNLDCNTQRRYLEQICESGETLHAIISDILDLSKIEAGRLTLEAVAFDLHALLASVAASYRELAQQKGLAFESRIEPDVPVHVVGDPTRLRQLLSNFLSNALKFTTHGEVALRCACVNERVRLSVSDTGIGIDAATRARLFNPFTQGDVSTTRRFGGTGLGLSICRHLAELMGGAVGVDSEPGAGSSFWVELPLPAAAASRLPAEVPDVSAAGALRGVRVLLAEDNDVNRLIAETLLTEWGASVVVAVDGRAAVAAVQDAGADFDVVLMDLHMPVMSGLEATEQLRQRYAPCVLPILALTAAALGPEREQCLAAGMNDFIAKPFEERQLLETLRRWTARRSAADGPSGG